MAYTGSPINGQLLIGDTGKPPSSAHLTSTGATVTITNGPGTINLEAAGGGGTPASFSAQLATSTDAVTGDATYYQIICDTVIFDTVSAYNVTTGNYTIPTTGNYLFTATVCLEGAAASNTVAEVNFQTNENQIALALANMFSSQTSGGQWATSSSAVLSLIEGDVVGLFIQVGSDSKTVSVAGSDQGQILTTFSGFMIG
jgi:hypothetical protein